MNADNVNLSSTRGRMETVESMRVLLTFWVLLSHFYKSQDTVGWASGRALIRNNQVPVYAFVVLSGFVTHWTSRLLSLKRWTAIGAYVQRRYSRTLFAYQCAVVFSFCMRYPGVCMNGTPIKEYLLFALANFLGLQCWFTWSSEMVYSGPCFLLSSALWTISALMFAWLVYPCVAQFLVSRNSFLWPLVGFLVCFSCGAAHRLLVPGSPEDHSAGWGPYQGYFWFPPFVLPLFFMGVYAAELAASMHNGTAPMQFRSVGPHLAMVLQLGIDFVFLMLFLVSATDIDLATMHYSLGPFVRTLWLVLGLILSTHTEGFLLGSVLLYPMQCAGAYSLPIYLFQMPVAQLLASAQYGFPVPKWPHFHSELMWCCFQTCLYAFAYMYVHLIEDDDIARSIDGRRKHERSVVDCLLPQ